MHILSIAGLILFSYFVIHNNSGAQTIFLKTAPFYASHKTLKISSEPFSGETGPFFPGLHFKKFSRHQIKLEFFKNSK